MHPDSRVYDNATVMPYHGRAAECERVEVERGYVHLYDERGEHPSRTLPVLAVTSVKIRLRQVAGPDYDPEYRPAVVTWRTRGTWGPDGEASEVACEHVTMVGDGWLRRLTKRPDGSYLSDHPPHTYSSVEWGAAHGDSTDTE